MPARPPFEQRLTLVSWFARQLGYASNVAMLADLSKSAEDWDDGQHPVLQVVTARDNGAISKGLLQELDHSIHADLRKVNASRREPITLKYFQYLAVLAVEYFLHRRTHDPHALLEELQDVADGAGPGHYPVPQNLDDLNKLALWMATGAGKTLLLHLNYHQFLRWHEDLFAPDNIILLTPNETLTNQHLNELRASGIPCSRFGEGGGGLAFGGRFPVRLLEITKLTDGKRGVVTLPTSELAGRNLLFVDEGHKGVGSVGQAWENRKRELASDGFTFEYSATYGQAFSQAGPITEIEDRYARSIICDYSYRHFHGDGYGKDFDVVNLGGDPTEDKQDLLMLGNLLVFLQQRACYSEHRQAFAWHNLEPPLLLLLGTTVTGGQGRTDIVDYLRFLQRTTTDVRWAKSAVRKLLQGKAGLADAMGQDVFAARLDWLNARFGGDAKGKAASPDATYSALLKHVFRVDGPGPLQFGPITGAKGEVALRISGGHHFGLIYVGNEATTKLRGLLEEECPDIQILDKTITQPLFHEVAQAGSPINLLIGAKKFMEGWSSWRVSGMGLLNVGKTEGPLIIQLFGRGVRLKGAGMSLKRGGGEHPAPHQSVLETMNIFGVKADFISSFRDMLEREGVWEEALRLPVSQPLERGFKQGLVVPEYPKEGFLAPVLLAALPELHVDIDIATTTTRTDSKHASRDGDTGGRRAREPQALSDAALRCLDWDALLCDLQDYRARRGLWNLGIEQGALKPILRECCAVICDADSLPEPATSKDLRRLHKVAASLLVKYADRFYNRHRSDWARSKVSYKPLRPDHPNLLGTGGGHLVLSVRSNQTEEDQRMVARLRELIGNEKRLQALWQEGSDDWRDPPPRVYFDNHLYQPLLIASKLAEKDIKASPPGLNDGEVEFVKALRVHLASNPLPDGEEIYLLRNMPSKGVDLFSEAGRTFPDFILWQKRPEQQRIVFVEPHGMLHARAYAKDPKAQLHEALAAVNAELQAKHRVQMDSYIISQTPERDLADRYGDGDWDSAKFRTHHILFPNDRDLIPTILGSG